MKDLWTSLMKLRFHDSTSKSINYAALFDFIYDLFKDCFISDQTDQVTDICVCFRAWSTFICEVWLMAVWSQQTV